MGNLNYYHVVLVMTLLPLFLVASIWVVAFYCIYVVDEKALDDAHQQAGELEAVVEAAARDVERAQRRGGELADIAAQLPARERSRELLDRADRGAELLGVQALGALAGAGFAFGAAALVWYGAKLTIGVRVQEDHEIHGLDQAECGMEAYDLGLTPATLPPTSVPTA